MNSPGDPPPPPSSPQHRAFCVIALTVFFTPVKLLQLEPTNYQHVQSAERSTERGNTNHKVQVQHYSLVLYCIVLCSRFSAACRDVARRHETHPGPRQPPPPSLPVAKERSEIQEGEEKSENLRINATGQFQGFGHQRLSASPLSGEAQAGLVC